MKFSSRLFITIFVFLFSLNAWAFTPDSTGVKTVDEKSFIIYKVAPKEGWFGIAKKYNVSIFDLQNANPQSGKDLKKDEEILVPLKAAIKESPQQATVIKEPIYYAVKKKETLYSISKKYNTVPDSLKKWNNISGKKVKSGEKVIVGYTVRIIEPLKKDTVAEKPKPVPPVVAKPKPKADSVSRKITPPKVKRPVDEQGIAAWIDDGDEKSKTFYALHRTAPAGTIMKVTNRMNKKYIFVKVLAPLQDTGDNTDLIIKISKSSAEKLGVRDKRFQCELNYSVLD
jgi:LysM repeat protein